MKDFSYLIGTNLSDPKTGRCALTNQRSPGYPLGTDLSNYEAQSIQPKFPGWGSKISWCRMDRDRFQRSRSIPLAKQDSRSFKMKDAGSLLLVLKLDDDFDGDINDLVWAASFIVI